MFWSAELIWMHAELNSAWSNQTVTEMALPVLGPAIVSRKLTQAEVINPIDIQALRNLHQDLVPALTLAQGPIRTQAQLKPVLGDLVEPLRKALAVYHHLPLSQQVQPKRKPLQPRLVKNQKKPVMPNQKGMS
jgi:hypothetical protein